MRKFNVTVNGTLYEVEVEELSGAADHTSAAAEPGAAPKPAPASSTPVSAPAPKAAAPASVAGSVKVSSPMPGTILSIHVTPNQTVKKGDLLCMLEAMKMENEIFAPQDGTVATVNVQKGASVKTGELLFTLR